MSDVLVVCIITAIVFILFALPRLLHVERRRRAIMSEAWRREQAKKDDEDDTTKTWPLPPAAV